jgi:Fe-S oxidoreductase
MALSDFAAESDWCSQCSGCKWIPYDQVKSWRYAKNCPSISYFNFNTYSARGRYAVTRSLLHDQSEITPEVEDVAFTCLACGSCDVSCKVCRYNLEPLEMVRELKFHAVENGHVRPELTATLENVDSTGNPMGLPRADRGKWADGIAVKQALPDKAEVLFFAGCKFSYDQELQGAARTALQILQKAGLDVAIAGPREMCCGGRWYSSGFRDEFNAMADANIKAWERAGIKTIVTPCSDCFHAIGRLYKERGAKFEVVHTVELIARLAAEGKLPFKKRVPMTVTWHDPCHLGRQGEPYEPWEGEYTKILEQVVVHTSKKPRYNGAKGVYDAPRDLLRAIPGVELVEMERIREYSWCCGAGGGVREAYPDYSLWTAAERVEEAKATGAEALVTACGWCERNFKDAAADGGPAMPVMDIMDLVARALEQEGAAE